MSNQIDAANDREFESRIPSRDDHGVLEVEVGIVDLDQGVALAGCSLDGAGSREGGLAQGLDRGRHVLGHGHQSSEGAVGGHGDASQSHSHTGRRKVETLGRKPQNRFPLSFDAFERTCVDFNLLPGTAFGL